MEGKVLNIRSVDSLLDENRFSFSVSNTSDGPSLMEYDVIVPSEAVVLITTQFQNR